MLTLLVAAAAATAPVPPQLAEAARALEAGRMDQARIMVAEAVKAGATGAPVDRLLADLAFTSGDNWTALVRYRALLLDEPGDARLLERAGIAALRLGNAGEARPLLERATAGGTATWRAWNALGVLADRRGDWPAADSAYTRAAQLAPANSEVANNLGWSLMLRGRWAQAVPPLERAVALNPSSRRIADNLELARAALSDDLPVRRPGESGADFAARLNDAGVIARLQGDRQRAVAAFTRALEVQSRWFERAANNLAAVSGR